MGVEEGGIAGADAVDDDVDRALELAQEDVQRQRPFGVQQVDRRLVGRRRRSRRRGDRRRFQREELVDLLVAEADRRPAAQRLVDVLPDAAAGGQRCHFGPVERPHPRLGSL